tara:strand:+ start:415 stop:531 length:117 start_codon:yes stop_codon:yes gene_type:complete
MEAELPKEPTRNMLRNTHNGEVRRNLRPLAEDYGMGGR